MKLNIFKASIATLYTAVSAALGKMFIPLFVLFAVMLLDYISGMLKAYMKAELNSKVGIFGIIKKLCYLLIVAAAMAFDWLIVYSAETVGFNFGFGGCFFTVLVTVWLIINEILSILENLIELKVPVPEFLRKAILSAKHKIETENKNGKEEN